MTNIEKLLDAMLKQGGSSLMLERGASPRIKAGDEEKPLSKVILTDRELDILRAEKRSLFEERELLEFGEKTLRYRDDGTMLLFTVAEAAALSIAEAMASLKMEKQTQPAEPVAKVSYSGTNTILKLLHLMVEKKASDLHVSSKCKPIMRIDGDMMPVDGFSELIEDEIMKSLGEFAPFKNLTEFKDSSDTDFAYEIQGLARFRTNIFRDHRGVCAVFRQIPSKILSAESLGVPEQVLRLCERPKGLVLVTGPTGSGKSTTLASLIDYINTNQKKHILTVEDPVEFIHPNRQSLINQREIKTHTSSFAKALRAALREDPDVILVGEMRDLETISIAVEMAVTGHLVFGTLHTSTAVGTVDRIIEQFPHEQQAQIRSMLADALAGVVSQMLCKKMGGGRVAALEILLVNLAVSNLIREGKTFQIPAIMQAAKSLGMRRMNESLLDLVVKGIVSPEESLSKSSEKDDLKAQLTTRGLLTK